MSDQSCVDGLVQCVEHAYLLGNSCQGKRCPRSSKSSGMFRFPVDLGEYTLGEQQRAVKGAEGRTSGASQ